VPVPLKSGHQRDARGLHHRRAPLAFREARRFFLVGVHATKLFTVGVEDGYQKMVMLAAAVLAKTIGFGLLRGYLLGHWDHSIL